MAGPTLYSVPSVCDALAGVKAIIYCDITNVGNYGPGFLPPAPDTPPSFYDSDLLYSIAYERYSGEITQESVTDQGGESYRQQVTIFVPRSRSEVHTLLRRMRGRLLMVIAIDRYDNQHILYDAIVSHRMTSGQRPGSRAGYQITFSATAHYLLPSIAGNGDILSAPPVGGGGGDIGSGECCITIAPLAIAYTPSPTGNALNLNEIVTTPNGSVYFIDSTGRSVLLNRPAPVYYFFNGDGVDVDEITLPMGFPLPDPADYPLPTYSEQDEMSIRLWVKYGSRWLQYDHAEGYTVDYAAGKVLIPGGTRGANLEFYSYEGIPPRPL
jgi:hypothetical protein